MKAYIEVSDDFMATLLAVAEEHARAGRIPQAIASYKSAAELYAMGGKPADASRMLIRIEELHSRASS